MSNQTTYTDALGKAQAQANRLQADVDRIRETGGVFTQWQSQPAATRVEAVKQLADAVGEAHKSLAAVHHIIDQLETLLDDYKSLRDDLLTVEATGREAIEEALPGSPKDNE